MKISHKIEGLNETLYLDPSYRHEANMLTAFGTFGETLSCVIKKDTHEQHPHIEIRREADKCQNTHKP